MYYFTVDGMLVADEFADLLVVDTEDNAVLVLEALGQHYPGSVCLWLKVT